MKAENVIEVKNITKKFKIYYDKGSTLKEKVLFRKRRAYEEREVLNNITFEVKKGEAIGLIGHNGCGKSTTLKLLSKIMYPDSGTIEMKGRVSSLIELGAGFHPDMSGRENIYINASIFGLTRKEIDARLEDIIEFSELEEYIDNPVRTYSSGMYMRLAFSVAINVDADILLIDEILAVGDTNFQAKCYNKMREIKVSGVTIVLVTHDSNVVERFCDKAVWINEGHIVSAGKSIHVVDEYLRFMNEKRYEEIVAKEKKEQEIVEDRKEENSTINLSEEAIDYTSNRFGYRYVEIVKVRMKNSKGEETLTLKTNEAVDIEIEYKVNREIQDYIFGYSITTLEGIVIAGTNTQIDRLNFSQIKTKGVVNLHIESLPLLLGRYILQVAVVDEDGTPMDFYREYCQFSVVSDIRSVGLVEIEHNWRVK